MAPTLGIVIPTAGRPSLRRTLDSMAPQMLPGDRCLVVGDVLDGPLPDTAAIVADFPWCRYIEHKGTAHTYGHEQINVGLPLVGGDWLLCQDDDDIFTDDAFATIRAAIAGLDSPRPLLFRFLSRFGVVYWDEHQRQAWARERRLVEGHIGGHCLVVPNLPGKVGKRGRRYAADYDQIVDTVARWHPVEPLFVDRVIAVARPKE